MIDELEDDLVEVLSVLDEVVMVRLPINVSTTFTVGHTTWFRKLVEQEVTVDVVAKVVTGTTIVVCVRLDEEELEVEPQSIPPKPRMPA